jgi:hypothetical protein
MATGAGQAEWGRLYAATVSCTVGALVILLLWPAWWLASTPLVCIASFAGWGLAAQKTIELDRRQLAAPKWRAMLQLARAATALIGGLAAFALIFGGFALLMQRG